MDKINTTLSEEINQYVSAIEEKHQTDYSLITELVSEHIKGQLIRVKTEFEEDPHLTAEQEIYYFKHIKCQLLGLIQYYHMVQKVELNKPPTSKKKVKKYYLKQLFKIKKKINKQRVLYNCYRSNATSLDKYFFRRPNKHNYLLCGDIMLEIDKNCSTGFIHLFVQFEAFDRMRHYLKQKIKADHTKPRSLPPTNQQNQNIKWTASKVDLVELIYGLYTAGVFNHGRADIKEIADYFQQTFDIDLRQIHRYFLDIKNRKKTKTKFLEEITQHLDKRMKDTENQLFF